MSLRPKNYAEHPASYGDLKPALYRSGVAARLAGIPVETLRVWERRYRIGEPQSSERGRRLYSRQTIERLRLVKQLVDAGNPIGSIAKMPMAELLQVRSETTGIAVGEAGPEMIVANMRVALVGAVKRLRWHAGLSVVGECSAVEQAVDALRDVQADIVIFEMESLLGLTREGIEAVKRVTDARAAIILYRFGPSDMIRQLRDAGHLVANANLDAAEIELLCSSALSRYPASRADAALPVPAARFDTAALETLVTSSSAIYCECPRHLAEILLTLGSFERYSSECKNRSPADAALHKGLQRAAGLARASLEDALLQVVIAEGLPLPDLAATAKR